jgi:hypothetical protein
MSLAAFSRVSLNLIFERQLQDLITGTISTKRAFFEAPEWQNCFGNTRPEQMLGVVSCKALFGAARATVFHTGIYV